MPRQSKQCSKCKVVKPLADFSKDSKKRDGLASACRVCKRAQFNNWRANNPEYSAARWKEWYDAHREEQRVATKEWREANKERHLANYRRWYEENKEYRAQWQKEYLANNYDKALSHNHNRRARLLEQFVEHVDREVVWKRDDGICGICGQPATKKKWHLDHIIPLALDGLHCYDNVQVSHPELQFKEGRKAHGGARSSITTRSKHV